MGQKSNPNSLAEKQTNNINYDDFPYESFPFTYTRPEHLRTIGLVFGMQPPMVENARILDIGCGEGGNMINFAESYPQSYSLGIDLSKTQIDNGLKVVNSLGLKNIELKHLSILDIDESFGKFDYIICHGVISWVPDEVREKIFAISSKLLSPNGIAFISYNTLPGWNMQKTIRDMMMFHSAIFTDKHDKLQQAKLLLDFVSDSLKEKETHYSKFLHHETNALKNLSNSYLLHEYLGEENIAFYFQEFISNARKHNLNYLGDSSLAAMFVGNLPEKTAEKLQSINDIVRTEQYMDFISNRKFRTTLLCHDNVRLNRAIEPSKLSDFHTTLDIRPATPENEADISNAVELGFYCSNSESPDISTSSPIMKAVFYTYADNIGNPLTLDQITTLAMKKLEKLQLKDFKEELDSVIIQLVLQGYVQIFATKPISIYNISSKPKVSNFVRYQAQKLGETNLFVTNRINHFVPLRLHEKYIIELLDGTNSIQQIEEKIFEKFASGLLVASDKNGIVSDEQLIKPYITHCVNVCLQKCKMNYLLIG
ncbi:methyltransferase regulatory domain-containing protein [Rickettsia endosymbiont of Culicoides newsteadi]|uniref:methyltransferase regulatory domain-containing protein n=1 Tax=Rickettsia endosymbiont of Culicoides newsteadi TaxID=1961830 RepID=UPI000B9A7727|nr:class I SAM-dependent methyltransferase [Rickettsia endosymbiont of Culicoides newsteadi]OZG32182.1 methyltransferase [Rickettsia endosymbiont of Culicoides newsteadi]